MVATAPLLPLLLCFAIFLSPCQGSLFGCPFPIKTRAATLAALLFLSFPLALFLSYTFSIVLVCKKARPFEKSFSNSSACCLGSLFAGRSTLARIGRSSQLASRGQGVLDFQIDPVQLLDLFRTVVALPAPVNLPV